MRGLVTAAVLVLLLGPPVVTGGQPPLADAGLDQRVDRGEQVIIDGMGSTDPDGSIARYHWSIEDPGGRAVAPACPDCAWTWFRARQPGRYTVTLSVTDDDGATRSDFLYVTVAAVRAAPSRVGRTGIGGRPANVRPTGTTQPSAPGGAAVDPTVPAGIRPNDATRSTWLGRPDQGGGLLGDLSITTYPTISPLGTDMGGVTYFTQPNGETQSTTGAVVEVLVRTR